MTAIRLTEMQRSDLLQCDDRQPFMWLSPGANKALDGLAEKGLLKRLGGGFYQMTDAGREMKARA